MDAAIQAVLDRDIAVIAYNITGNIRSCQVAFSRLKQSEPMIDHSNIFWRFGTRKWARISKVSVAGAPGFEPGTSCSEGKRPIQTRLRARVPSIPFYS